MTMSMNPSESDPGETIPSDDLAGPFDDLPAEGWTLVALIADPGAEPMSDLAERTALGTWCAVTALWHPALLAGATGLPTIEDIEAPTAPGPREVRIIAEGAADRLASGHRPQAEDAGSVVLDGGTDRLALVGEVRARIGKEGAADRPLDDPVALDFLALGTARWLLHDLTIAMGQVDALDLESLTREVLAGASAWQSGDLATATNRLRAGFELLTQARERFYPVDAYLVDICLVDPAVSAGALSAALAARAPVTFLAPASAIEALAARDPEALEALRQGISEGWADVAGGAYAEADEPLLPLDSVLWQFRRGNEVYRKHLDDRTVESLARRRFGLYPQLPQVAKRYGFRFAVHLGFDAGRFPLRTEPKRLWEAPDGSSLETLTRPPLGADRASSGVQFPWRLAQSLKDDHVATIGLVHWPDRLAPWYVDLRRVVAYSPVLARWTTLNDYFHLTDRPFESFQGEPDQYETPYLAQAVARRDARPISLRAEHARLRARLDALASLRGLASAVLARAPEPAAAPAPLAVEDALETGRLDEARAGLDQLEPAWAGALARAVVGEASGGRPGFLVLNPLGIRRRVAVLLPEAAPDLRPEGPLRASQYTDEGVWAVIDLPAFGYAWVPRETNVEHPPVNAGGVSARGQVLRNEFMTVEIDPATGGVRGLHNVAEEVARLGQQLAMTGLEGPDGAPVTSRMRRDAFEVEYGGPALVQATARGSIVESGSDRKLAAFRQRYRLWTGRPLLEIDIELDQIDPVWLERADRADPWAHFVACRWAWPDPSSMLRRTGYLSPELTDADRPETPDAIDISTRRQRTALVFGGLAHHQKHGGRMLDTLLVAGRESARSFKVGVALDLEYPFHAAQDLITPAQVVPTDAGPPRSGPSGWLVQVDNKAVAVTRVEYVDQSNDGRGWGLAFHLIETAGRASRCKLRVFRNPTWARQTDFNLDPVVDLPTEGDAVLIDLTPHEMVRIDVTLG
jgi:alpha-mannosidase